MIIQLESITGENIAGENIAAARHDLETLAQTWGHELTDATHHRPKPAEPTHPDRDKGIDPIAVSALVLSLPSVAVAALDLADRIRKRRRADELIERPQPGRAPGGRAAARPAPTRRAELTDPRRTPRPARRRRPHRLIDTFQVNS